MQAQYPDYDPSEYGGYEYGEERVQIALLLDVSGSMDGLIEQAKSQLWEMVNGIMYSYDGAAPPQLELALYQYGSDGLRASDRYLQQLVPFTRDLDWISEELFHLEARGRYEYCGAVVESALYDLDWSSRSDDLHMIYIAGNESFGQGPVSARRVLQDAARRGVYVNTIYCGDDYKGRREGWQEAARLGQGEYITINQDYHDYDGGDPYDEQLLGLNRQLNQTYVPFGAQAYVYSQRQAREDRNALQYGAGVASQRAITKASPAYQQAQWDLVDAVASGKVRLETLSPSDLPPNMRRMTLMEQRAYLKKQASRRNVLRQEIQKVAVAKRASPKPKPQRTRPASPGSSWSSPSLSPQKSTTLGDAILQSTRKKQQRSTGTRTTPKPQPKPNPASTRSTPKPRSSTPTIQSRPKPRTSTPTVRSTPNPRSSTPSIQSKPKPRTSSPSVRSAPKPRTSSPKPSSTSRRAPVQKKQ